MRGRSLAAALAVAVGVSMVSPMVSRGALPLPTKANRPTNYITMPDGTSIALNIQFPAPPRPAGGWPVIFTIDGYEGASAPVDPAHFGNHYVVIHMSLRGTGCSGGSFDLFDRRSAMDGYHAIEWAAAQPWSDGKVGIQGHSYGGITGWLVTATQPPHLKAVALSGLIDDLYKGITYMGGVSNLGFPLLWSGAYRPLRDVGAGTLEAISNGDTQCAKNLAGRVPPNAADDPIVNGVASLGEENQWWVSHSLITYLDGINVPIEISQTYQDEQTGPRGSNLLWQRLDQAKPSLPKRLLLTNGLHDTNVQPPAMWNDKLAWLDCYVRGVCTPDILDQTTRVHVLWEMHRNASGALVPNGMTTDSAWPLSVTQWVRYYLGAGNRLSTSRGSGKADAYLSGSKRAGAWTALGGQLGVTDTSNTGAPLTTANLPDEVRYASAPFGSDVAVAGPIDMTLYASSSAADTEFYVEMDDIDQQANMTRLQRGMLKASHRAIDPLLTDYDAAGDIIRPYHPDTNTLTAVIVPGKVYEYEIEIFPLGFIVRAGHRLVLRITAPPANDSLATYVPTTAPSVNFVYHDAADPSSILLPVVPAADVSVGPAIGCGRQIGLERCSKPIN
jgi:uncharacterized protein